MYPDISVGKMFSNYLKKIDSEFNDTFKYYSHSFPDDRPPVDARMYPIEALPVFRRFVFEKWIPENAQNYFKERDPLALDYLQRNKRKRLLPILITNINKYDDLYHRYVLL